MELEKKLIDYLIRKEICKQEDINKALHIQNNFKNKIGNILLNLGSINELQYLESLSHLLSIQILTDEHIKSFKQINFKNINHNLFIKKNIYPFFETEKEIFFALDYNLNFDSSLFLKKFTEKEFKFFLSTQDEIEAIKSLYNEVNNNKSIDIDDDELEKLKEIASEAPVIKTINNHFNLAVEDKASDIHYETFKKGMIVRLRIDGKLKKIDTIPLHLKKAIIVRLKLLSKMNISENRLPQDGRISIKVSNQEIDIRASSVPTAFGESFVLRLLGKQEISYSISSLDFYEDHVNLLMSIINKPNGIFLTTGPTGSGKTTTLYSVLNEINNEDTKIITVEDPVEYELEGINQIQVKSSINFTFANALKSILRQDPDTIMIGEIRDQETARIAIQSSLTGHRVLSTIHTNSALGGITRLLDMGIEYYLLKSSINGLMAQRLVRKLCPKCKEEIKISKETIELLKINDLIIKYNFTKFNTYKHCGCEYCNFTGYKGRLPIIEIAPFNDVIKDALEKNKNNTNLSNFGFRTLFEDGILKFLDGKTSLEEILKVIND